MWIRVRVCEDYHLETTYKDVDNGRIVSIRNVTKLWSPEVFRKLGRSHVDKEVRILIKERCKLSNCPWDRAGEDGLCQTGEKRRAKELREHAVSGCNGGVSSGDIRLYGGNK